MKINILSFAQPHMRSFHLSWMSFFTAFLSTFAAAPMIPVVRENLNLTKGDLGNAGIAAVCGNILGRVVMGWVCDTYGPRFGHSVLMLSTAPAVFCMSLVTTPIGFIMSRFVIGFGLGVLSDGCAYAPVGLPSSRAPRRNRDESPPRRRRDAPGTC